MYIYADESGHSGRYIFNEPHVYYQGAIFSTEDIEEIITPIITKVLYASDLDRIHANELKPYQNIDLIKNCIDALKDYKWEFFLSQIHKPYLSVTKFVDTIFDPADNKGIPPFWYWEDYYRHSLCCLFDDALTEKSKKQFWLAYLGDNREEIINILRNVRNYVNRFCKIGSELNTVAIDGINFAIRNPEELGLFNTEKKSAYKMSTPNMVAFSILLQAVHVFCEEHKASPKKFIHDQQSEFGSTMKDYHKIFHKVKVRDELTGKVPLVEYSEYDLGSLSLESSKKSYGLQFIDLLIWIHQREETDEIKKIKDIIPTYSNNSYISRGTSELIKIAFGMRR